MNDVTRDLMEALGDCLTFIEKRHVGNWVTQQARAAISRAEATLAEPKASDGKPFMRGCEMRDDAVGVFKP